MGIIQYSMMDMQRREKGSYESLGMVRECSTQDLSLGFK